VTGTTETRETRLSGGQAASGPPPGETLDLALRGRIAMQFNLLGVPAAEADRRLDAADDKAELLAEMIVAAGRLAGEPELQYTDPPPAGDIVRHLTQWLDPLHPYSTFLDWPFGEHAVQFLRGSLDQIARHGDAARFTERQCDWLRALWRKAVQEITAAIARARREAKG